MGTHTRWITLHNLSLCYISSKYVGKKMATFFPELLFESWNAYCIRYRNLSSHSTILPTRPRSNQTWTVLYHIIENILSYQPSYSPYLHLEFHHTRSITKKIQCRDCSGVTMHHSHRAINLGDQVVRTFHWVQTLFFDLLSTWGSSNSFHLVSSSAKCSTT